MADSKLADEKSPLVKENLSKYSYLPIKYPILEKYYQDQKNVFWTPQELDFMGDREDWDKLDDDTRHFIKFVLFFFAQADGIVNENLVEHFKKETSYYKEARAFYAIQELIEVIHNETYSLLIEAFIRDPAEKEKAFNAICYYPSIQKLADWIFERMRSDRPLSERLICMACVEGIFFSGAFAAIYWIKRSNILKALCKANEFIARDEAMHVLWAVDLYHIETKVEKRTEVLTEETVHDIIKSAMDVSEEFIRDALRVDLIGMSADDMVSYVKGTADTLSKNLGYKTIYDVENPFEWMAVIGLPNKTSFFESRVTEYGRQSVADFEFKLDSDF